jgi:hypothetical protein
MSPEAGLLLVDEIVPRILAAVGRGSVKPVGSEDHEELAADCTAMAAQMLDHAERAGKPLYAASVAFYAAQSSKVGRRSTSASQTGVLSPACQIQGNSIVESMDAALVTNETETDEVTLHDVLAHRDEDPGTLAARKMDWGDLTRSMDERSVDILLATAQGCMVKEIAATYGISPARVVQIKRQIAGTIKSTWGTKAMENVLSLPQWRRSVRSKPIRYNRHLPTGSVPDGQECPVEQAVA